MNAPTIGPIERFMVTDHVSIDDFLAASQAPDGAIDLRAYERFRHDLLRHIGMEEKVLLPFARAKQGGEPLAIARTLRADHGAIAKLLVRTPTPEIVESLRELLGRHNALEEGPGGLYATLDALAGDEAASVVQALETRPAVPLSDYYDGTIGSR
jgi:hypothetical protein